MSSIHITLLLLRNAMKDFLYDVYTHVIVGFVYVGFAKRTVI